MMRGRWAVQGIRQVRSSGALVAGLVCALVGAVAAPAQEKETPAIKAPAALVPFEHLVGTWKGVGIPTGNKLKGWQETHVFGWSFEKGQPVALTLEFTGSKLIARGKLRPEGDGYVLEGVDSDDNPVKWTGAYDNSAQIPTLTLTPDLQADDTPARRLVVRLLDNKEGYTFWDERKSGTKFTRSVEIRMSRNDPAMASSGGPSGKPKCIITGGEGTLTVSYQGKTYPVCCTGCRDEFLAEPEKYVAKLAKKAAAANQPAQPAEPQAKPTEPARKAEAHEEARPEKNPAPPKPAADKAAELLKRAQGLEKAGNKSAALIYYERVVKEHAKSPQAKTAAERVKALGGK